MAVLLRSIAEDDDEGDDAGDRDVNSVVLQYTATYHATSTIIYYNFIEQWWWWWWWRRWALVAIDAADDCWWPA